MLPPPDRTCVARMRTPHIGIPWALLASVAIVSSSSPYLASRASTTISSTPLQGTGSSNSDHTASAPSLGSHNNSTSQTVAGCRAVFGGKSLFFPHCLTLDPNATFSLAWGPTARNTTRGTGSNVTRGTDGAGGGGTFTVLFEGTPEAARGWAGWGISPRGFMAGSDALVAYGGAASGAPAQGTEEQRGTGTGAGAQGAARVYHMKGLEPVAVSPPLAQQQGRGSVYSDTGGPRGDGYSDSTTAGSASGDQGLLLDVVPSSLAWEVLSSNQGSGTRVRVLVDVTGFGSGPVHVIWRGGPGADVSTGRLWVHQSFSKASFLVDFGSGLATHVPGPPSRRNQVIAHSFLTGMGFGVLLPVGALVARHLKPWTPLWWGAHIGTQVGGYCAGVAGWGLGLWLKAQGDKERDFSDAPGEEVAHFGIGVAIFCAATLQTLTPLLKPLKGAPLRRRWNVAHWSLGYATILLSFVNVFLGFSVLGARLDIQAWRTAYIVFLSVWGGLFLLLEPVSWYGHARAQGIGQEGAKKGAGVLPAGKTAWEDGHDSKPAAGGVQHGTDSVA